MLAAIKLCRKFPAQVGGQWSAPVYWQGLVNGQPQNMVYFIGDGDIPKMFTLTNGLLSTTPVSKATGVAFGYPGASPSISANGAANGILWAIDTAAYASLGPAILRAFNADGSYEAVVQQQSGP